MALGENNGGPDFPVDEWGDMARVASMLEDLVDEGLTIEAMVRLKRLRIADQAEALVRISTEAQTALLDVLPSEDLGAIIEDLEVEEAVAFCERLAIDKLPVIFDAASPHIAADVLRALEPASAEDVIAEMETAPDVIPLLEYEDDAAGGLMTPEFVALRETMTVEQALDFVRLWAREIGPDPEYLHYLFVVDWEGALKGGLSLAQLVLASRGQFVSLLMDEDIISVGVETDQEEAARLMERYDIFNLPVVDDDGRLVGVVWLDDMIRVLEDEATEDMFRMIGVGSGGEGSRALLEVGAEQAAVAGGELRDGGTCGVCHHAVSEHDGAGGGACGVSACDSGAGRNCRDADAHADNSFDNAGRSLAGECATTAAEGTGARAGAWTCAWAGGRTDCVHLEGERVSCAGGGDCDGRESCGGGDKRGGGAAWLQGTEDRPGAVLGGGCDHADGCARIPGVPWSCDGGDRVDCGEFVIRCEVSAISCQGLR